MRLAAAAVVLLAVLVTGVLTNRATLEQAQRQSARDLRTLIAVCRVSTPTLSPTQMAFCERRIPGFQQARANAAKQAKTARRLEDLQEWAKGKGWQPPG